MTTMADEKERLLDEEAEALASIYGDEICASTSPEREYIVTMIASNGEACHLHVVLGPGYPQTPPAEISVEAAGRSLATREAVREAMLLAMAPGEPGIYSAVEAAREVLDEKLSQQLPASSCLYNNGGKLQPEGSGNKLLPTGASAASDESVNDLKFDFDPSNSVKYEQHVQRFDAEYAALKQTVEIVSGEPVTEKKSVFQAHLAFGITSHHQVNWAMRALLEVPKIARATHNISAYRFLDESKGGGAPVQVANNNDDGEDGAGVKLAQLIDIMKAQGVLVVVSRWYGGIHLGPDRFRIINNTARSLLADRGFGRATDMSGSGSKEKRNKKGARGGT
jgi:hypothetical protein